jgi:hypothetical protein
MGRRLAFCWHLIACASLGAFIASSSGCAHFRVAPDGLNPSTAEQKRHVNAFVWGALEPRVAPPNCEGNGLASVTVKTSLVDALVTVVTIGFWTPMTVEWTCAKDPGAQAR